MVRKAISFLLVLALILSFSLCSFEPSLAQIPISAPSAILIDARTGQVLLDKNSHQRRPIASTTKIMTAILAIEKAKLDDVATTSPGAASVGESESYLSPGEKITIKDLLYAILLKSANDACAVAAEHLSGSVAKFAEAMNKKAQELDMKDSHFVNPHGLQDPNHFSSAYDLSKLARYALANPTFAQIVATENYAIPWPGHSYSRVFENHNKLLWRYQYANGVKTGFTRQAGHCLVASANKRGTQLISVVLGCPSSESCFDDSVRLLEYGFNNFKPTAIIEKGKVYKKIKLPTLSNNYLKLIAKGNVTIQLNQSSKVEKSIKVKKVTLDELPLTKGQRLGTITVIVDNQKLAKVVLIAKRSIPEPNIFERVILFFKAS